MEENNIFERGFATFDVNYYKLITINYNTIKRSIIKGLVMYDSDNINDYTHLPFFQVGDIIYEYFKPYLEIRYLKLFEEICYQNRKEELIISNYSDKYFVLKDNLSKEERQELKKLRKKFFDFEYTLEYDSKKIIDFNISPYTAISNNINANYKYKITKSLIGYYKLYKELELLFGEPILKKLLLKSKVDDYINYLSMIKYLKEIVDSNYENYEYVKFLFDNFEDVAIFYFDILEQY